MKLPLFSSRYSSLWLLYYGSLASVVVYFFPMGFPGFSICIFERITTLPCPGCGLTRAFWLVTHGRFFEALLYHPFAPFFVFGALVMIVAAFVNPLSDWLLKKQKTMTQILFGGTLVILAFGVIRLGFFVFFPDMAGSFFHPGLRSF